MKKKILVLGLIFLLSFAYCKSPASPDIEEILESQEETPSLSNANVIMNGNPVWFTDRFTYDNKPIFGYSGWTDGTGILINIGEKTALSVKVEAILYDSNGNYLSRKTVNPSYKNNIQSQETAKWQIIWLKEDNSWWQNVDSQKTKFNITWNE